VTGDIRKSETLWQYFNFLLRWSKYLSAWAPVLQVETLMGVTLGAVGFSSVLSRQVDTAADP
jgi:hypothetical protein